MVQLWKSRVIRIQVECNGSAFALAHNSARAQEVGHKICVAKVGNPVIADWVQFRLVLSEGLLGGWLAQRQAALRGKLAAGARSNFALVSRACRD
jgi:hypothetical protein